MPEAASAMQRVPARAPVSFAAGAAAAAVHGALVARLLTDPAERALRARWLRRPATR